MNEILAPTYGWAYIDSKRIRFTHKTSDVSITSAARKLVRVFCDEGVK